MGCPQLNDIYYNYRYYSAELGRWLSRDPIGEKGGFNLYAMVRNNLLYSIDILGQETYKLDVKWGDGFSGVRIDVEVTDEPDKCQSHILDIEQPVLHLTGSIFGLDVGYGITYKAYTIAGWHYDEIKKCRRKCIVNITIKQTVVAWIGIRTFRAEKNIYEGPWHSI